MFCRDALGTLVNASGLPHRAPIYTSESYAHTVYTPWGYCEEVRSRLHAVCKTLNIVLEVLNTSLRTRGECAIRKVRECNLQRPETTTTRSYLQNRPLLPELSRNGVLPNSCDTLSLPRRPATDGEMVK